MHQHALADDAVVMPQDLAVGARPAVPSASRLVLIYATSFGLYLLAMAALWAVGVEGVYGSPMPFYALVSPVFIEAGLWHLAPLAVAAISFTALAVFWTRTDWTSGGPSRRSTAWFICAAVVFAFMFAGAVAMLRGGFDGISHAYQRPAYEYIGDIGLTGGIRALFRDYEKIHPFLSMHSKVHPPGPIALLWMMSYIVGQSPLALSLATMAFGAIAIVPLYLWTADIAGKRVAMTTVVLYALMPTIVLFTATSGDILFMPFVMAMLFFFWRSLERKPLAYGFAAGIFYGFCSLLSFSLLSIGAFFGFAGLWRMADKKSRWNVPITALAMIAGLLAVNIAVKAWSGFDIIACFHYSKAQFDLDQAYLDMLAPRYPPWAFRIANPATWFYFAGIPVSILLIKRLLQPEKNSRAIFIVFALTLFALNLLYLGRGEGERSAMYIMPFMAIPAAHMLDTFTKEGRRRAPFIATAGFMAFQCWFTESVFYTFW